MPCATFGVEASSIEASKPIEAEQAAKLLLVSLQAAS